MSYLGSKAASGVYQKIIAEMPPHDTYIETHLGGGAIMLRKPPARHNIGIDKDEEALTNFMEREGYGQIPNLQLVNRDAVDVLERFFLYPPAAGNRVLLYVDPPYLHETRTSNARYRCEYQVADHVRLLTCLKSLPPEIQIIPVWLPVAALRRSFTGLAQQRISGHDARRCANRKNLDELPGGARVFPCVCRKRLQ